jgi:glutaredoxin
MSTYHMEDYTCPYCHQSFPVSVCDTIESDTDPDIKERLLSGNLFVVRCPHCRMDSSITSPLTYIDADRGYTLRLLNAFQHETAESLNEMLEQNRQAGPYAFRVAAMQYRAVYSLPDLQEKIRIFDNDLNDKVIELTKLFVAARMEKETDATAEDIFLAPGVPPVETPIAFYITTTDGRRAAVDFPHDLYELMEECFSSATAPVTPGRYEIIDRSWAVHIARASTETPFWESPRRVN